MKSEPWLIFIATSLSCGVFSCKTIKSQEAQVQGELCPAVPENAICTVTSKLGANMRVEPNTSSGVQETLSPAAQVTYRNQNFQGPDICWMQVRAADAREGWIASQLMHCVPPPESNGGGTSVTPDSLQAVADQFVNNSTHCDPKEECSIAMIETTTGDAAYFQADVVRHPWSTVKLFFVAAAVREMLKHNLDPTSYQDAKGSFYTNATESLHHSRLWQSALVLSQLGIVAQAAPEERYLLPMQRVRALASDYNIANFDIKRWCVDGEAHGYEKDFCAMKADANAVTMRADMQTLQKIWEDASLAAQIRKLTVQDYWAYTAAANSVVKVYHKMGYGVPEGASHLNFSDVGVFERVDGCYRVVVAYWRETNVSSKPPYQKANGEWVDPRTDVGAFGAMTLGQGIVDYLMKKPPC